MTRLSRRGLLVRAGAAAVLAAAVSAQASPAAAQDGGCAGVAVVVDSGRGEPSVGCAADPGDGMEALAQAGFAVVQVGSFPGAVCRIDDFPETDCGPMPPAGASWSYWYADEAGEWVFSSGGALTRDPDEGDVEGWVFGDGSEPPGLSPVEAAGAARAAEATGAEETEAEGGGSPTWLIAVAVLALIAGLVVWRLRRDKRA